MLLFLTIKHIVLFKSTPLNATTEDGSGKLQPGCADQVNSDKETAEEKKHPTFMRAWPPLHHYTDPVYHAVFSSVVNAATNLAS